MRYFLNAVLAVAELANHDAHCAFLLEKYIESCLNAHDGSEIQIFLISKATLVAFSGRKAVGFILFPEFRLLGWVVKRWGLYISVFNIYLAVLEKWLCLMFFII